MWPSGLTAAPGACRMFCSSRKVIGTLRLGQQRGREQRRGQEAGAPSRDGHGKDRTGRVRSRVTPGEGRTSFYVLRRWRQECWTTGPADVPPTSRLEGAWRGLRAVHMIGTMQANYRNRLALPLLAVSLGTACSAGRPSGAGPGDSAFVSLASQVIEDGLKRHPASATDLGIHKYDDQLEDVSAARSAPSRRRSRTSARGSWRSTRRRCRQTGSSTARC